jgi:hypothetical protein
MLITEAAVLDFQRYFIDSRISHRESGDKIYGALGDPDLTVTMFRNALNITSEHFGGPVHDLEIVISDDMYRGGDQQRSLYSADLVVQILQRDDITAGAYEDIDEMNFLWWNAERVVVNSDRYAWASPDSVALRAALDQAGITYRTADLGHYFYTPDE